MDPHPRCADLHVAIPATTKNSGGPTERNLEHSNAIPVEVYKAGALADSRS